MPKPFRIMDLGALVCLTRRRKPEDNGNSLEQPKETKIHTSVDGDGSDNVQVDTNCGYGLESLTFGSMGGMWVAVEEIGRR